MTTPRNTIDRLNKLMLSDEEFRQIHHLYLTGTKKYETIKSHVDYLDSIQNYRDKESNNYIVGLRLACLEKLIKSGFDTKTAIEKCKMEYPFNERL